MKPFAKLFGDPTTGQIVVMSDTNDACDPAVKIYFHPPGFGVCSVAIGFEDSDAGWDNRDVAFEKFTEESAVSIVKNQLFNMNAAGLINCIDDQA